MDKTRKNRESDGASNTEVFILRGAWVIFLVKCLNIGSLYIFMSLLPSCKHVTYRAEQTGLLNKDIYGPYGIMQKTNNGLIVPFST